MQSSSLDNGITSKFEHSVNKDILAIPSISSFSTLLKSKSATTISNIGYPLVDLVPKDLILSVRYSRLLFKEFFNLYLLTMVQFSEIHLLISLIRATLSCGANISDISL